MPAATAKTSGSRNGTRPSSEWAMVIRSALTRMSPRSHVYTSMYCMAVTGASWATSAQHGAVTLEPHILAAVSLHGLARRFQRGRDRSEEAVLRGVATLGWAWPQMMDDGGGNLALNVSDGAWAGSPSRCRTTSVSPSLGEAC